MKKQFFYQLGDIILSWKYIIIFVIVALVALAALGLDKIIVDNSNESLFQKDDNIILLNKEFETVFGNEDFVFVMLEGDVFSHEFLSFTRDVSERIYEEVPFVKNVTSLTDLEFTEVIDGDLYIDQLIDYDIPKDSQTLNEIKEKVMSKDLLRDRIASVDGQSAAVFVEFDNFPEAVYVSLDHDPSSPYLRSDIYFEGELEDVSGFRTVSEMRTIISPAIDHVLADFGNTPYTITATGGPIIDYKIDRTIEKEVLKTFILTLVIAIILMSIIFRSFKAVAATVGVIILSTITTFGLIGWFGIVLSTFASIIVCLLLVLSVSYSIHVINHFQAAYFESQDKRKALLYAFSHSGWPCLVTAVTTAIGFAAFILVPIVPIKYLGISCTIGVSLAYLFVITLVPISLSFGKVRTKPSRGEERGIAPSSFMENWAQWSLKHGKSISITALGISAVLMAFIPRVEVDTDFIRMFGQGCSFVTEAEHVANGLGALYSYEVMIELPEDGMAKDPDILRGLEKIEDFVKDQDTTKKTRSLNDLLKDISQILNNNNRDYYTLPKSRELVTQFLLLYEMSGGEELNNWIDYSERRLRLSVQVNQSTVRLNETFQVIQDLSEQTFPSGTKVSISGDMPIFLKTVDVLVNGQITSILVAFLGISLMMIFILKSPRIGLISMIPNMLPVGIMLGVMGLMDITLNLQTVIVAPLLIGIAVDDTIHYFIHFRAEFNDCGNYAQANKQTFKSIGWALVFTSAILIIGFSAFLFSTINSLQQLAILLAVGILAALLSDLLLTPYLFVLFKPFGKEVPSQTRLKEEILTGDRK